MAKYDISVNDVANGIPLGHPKPHNRTHYTEYHSKVNARLHSVETNMRKNGYVSKMILFHTYYTSKKIFNGYILC